MRILSVNHSDSQGGAARAARNLHQALILKGVQSQLLVKNKSSNDETIIPVSYFESRNILSRQGNYALNKFKNKLQKYQWSRYPRKEDAFLSDLRSIPVNDAFQKLDYDILHLHWINLRFLDLHELKKIRRPIIWTLHDCWPFTGICHYTYDCKRYENECGDCPFLHSGNGNDLSHKIWKSKSKIYMSLDLHIVTPSKWLAVNARKSKLFSRFPVSVIPGFVNTELFSPGNRKDACRQAGLDTEKKYILFAAMNAVKDKNKGFDNLLNALCLLENKSEFSKTSLVVVGSEKSQLDLNLRIDITFMGKVENEAEMAKMYKASSVTVVPSLSENLSFVIMESLACGVPVVAFNIGGNSEMIEHKGNGYLAKPFDCGDLAEGLIWSLSNEDTVFRMKARTKILENHVENKVTDQYINLYKNLYNRLI